MAPRAGIRQSPGVNLEPIGVIRSSLKDRKSSPRQGIEGAPDAWLEIEPRLAPALLGLAAGDELLVFTWFHQGKRDVLQVHPRNDPKAPLTGVFATRSPDRPNPIGLHPVVVRKVEKRRIRVGPIEAIDGTPVVDLKPVIRASGANVRAKVKTKARSGSRSRTARAASSSRSRT